MTWMVTVMVIVFMSLLPGCRYSKHDGRVGEDRRPLDLINEHRVPRIDFGKSTPEELEGLLRPTVMTVYFQPQKTKMGDMAEGYALRVQVMPDGFANESPSFSYGSPAVPKTAIMSLKPKQISSVAPLIRKLGEVRPGDLKLPVKRGEADLGSVIPEQFQQPRREKKSSEAITGERRKAVSQANPQANPHENAADIKALALKALQERVKAAPSPTGTGVKITPPGNAAPVLPGGLDPKLSTLDYLEQIFKRGQ